jgi:hypothetical protein
LDKSRPHISDPTYSNDPGWTVFHLPSTPDGILIPDHPDRSGGALQGSGGVSPEARSVHAASASTAPSWGILLRPRRRSSGTVWLAGAAVPGTCEFVCCCHFDWSSWRSAKLVMRAAATFCRRDRPVTIVFRGKGVVYSTAMAAPLVVAQTKDDVRRRHSIRQGTLWPYASCDVWPQVRRIRTGSRIDGAFVESPGCTGAAAGGGPRSVESGTARGDGRISSCRVAHVVCC